MLQTFDRRLEFPLLLIVLGADASYLVILGARLFPRRFQQFHVFSQLDQLFAPPLLPPPPPPSAPPAGSPPPACSILRASWARRRAWLTISWEMCLHEFGKLVR